MPYKITRFGIFLLLRTIRRHRQTNIRTELPFETQCLIWKIRYKRWEDFGRQDRLHREAGLCLAILAQKSSREYILVTVGGNHESAKYNIDDAYAVYNKLWRYFY